VILVVLRVLWNNFVRYSGRSEISRLLVKLVTYLSVRLRIDFTGMIFLDCTRVKYGQTLLEVKRILHLRLDLFWVKEGHIYSFVCLGLSPFLNRGWLQFFGSHVEAVGLV